ncbi:MAG TPA: hypothetical protein VJI67_03270 [archaeon]|nr:hypothetical protein [archaeon]
MNPDKITNAVEFFIAWFKGKLPEDLKNSSNARITQQAVALGLTRDQFAELLRKRARSVDDNGRTLDALEILLMPKSRRQKVLAGRAGWKTPEQKAARTEANRANASRQWQDPETRAALSESGAKTLQAFWQNVTPQQLTKIRQNKQVTASSRTPERQAEVIEARRRAGRARWDLTEEGKKEVSKTFSDLRRKTEENRTPAEKARLSVEQSERQRREVAGMTPRQRNSYSREMSEKSGKGWEGVPFQERQKRSKAMNAAKKRKRRGLA